MIKRIKLFSIIFILLSILLTGCAFEDYLDIYKRFNYEVKDDVLVDNKIYAALGTDYFKKDEDNGFLETTYCDVLIRIFVDNEETPVDFINIGFDNFFSSKYYVNDDVSPLKLENFTTYHEINVSDYIIANFIRIEINFQKFRTFRPEYYTSYLKIYGHTEGENFIVENIETDANFVFK